MFIVIRFFIFVSNFISSVLFSYHVRYNKYSTIFIVIVLFKKKLYTIIKLFFLHLHSILTKENSTL